MPPIIIRTQAEFDALPAKYDQWQEIQILSDAGLWIQIRTTPGNATVRAYGNATVRADGNATVSADGNATVSAYGNATVSAYGNATVSAYGNATVSADGNATVSADGNATVSADGNATVRADGNAGVRVESDAASVLLLGFSVAWAIAKKAKIKKKAKTATIIKPVHKTGAAAWLGRHGIDVKAGVVTLFKRVSADFKTQEKQPNETLWAVGKTLEHHDWRPKEEECGPGKYHASPEPMAADFYRDMTGDRYIAIEIAVKDLYAWPTSPQHPHKIAFRKGTVLHEVDRLGRKK